MRELAIAKTKNETFLKVFMFLLIADVRVGAHEHLSYTSVPKDELFSRVSAGVFKLGFVELGRRGVDKDGSK